MFDKISRLAEAAATSASVSRRGFLGQLGRGALAAAGVVSGLLFSAREAHAQGGVVCCYYYCYGKAYSINYRKKTCQKAGTTCAPTADGGKCSLKFISTAAACKDC
ncbi:MAG TPA: hypothetical protein VFA18_07795 [Gemmataceae bacterium]|nr:hypothetical protein [Gemmataceae bacterium]